MINFDQTLPQQDGLLYHYESKFINSNAEILNHFYSKFEKVLYANKIFRKDLDLTSLPNDIVTDNYHHLFFQKNPDWKHEFEKRLMCIDGPEYLSISSCIEAVLIGKNATSTSYSDLASTIAGTSLIPHDFCFQANMDGHIKVYDAAFKIINSVKGLKDQLNSIDDYLKYLEREHGYDSL